MGDEGNPRFTQLRYRCEELKLGSPGPLAFGIASSMHRSPSIQFSVSSRGPVAQDRRFWGSFDIGRDHLVPSEMALQDQSFRRGYLGLDSVKNPCATSLRALSLNDGVPQDSRDENGPNIERGEKLLSLFAKL